MIKITNNTKNFFKALNPVIDSAIEKVARNTESFVKEEFVLFKKKPIKTGDLRRSINIFPREKGGFYLSAGYSPDTNKNLEYAIYVEEGTIKMPARPYMRNGIARAKDSNDSIMEKYLNVDNI